MIKPVTIEMLENNNQRCSLSFVLRRAFYLMLQKRNSRKSLLMAFFPPSTHLYYLIYSINTIFFLFIVLKCTGAGGVGGWEWNRRCRINIIPPHPSKKIAVQIVRNASSAHHAAQIYGTVLIPLLNLSKQWINSFPIITLTIPLSPNQFYWNAFMNA
jgi:hypothetical protein